MAPVSESLAKAVKHHRAGQLRKAVWLYREVLRFDPGHADTLHLLGLAEHQRKRHQSAIDHISRAIKTNGANASFHCNLGAALMAEGRLDEAVESFRKAIGITPGYVGARYNLGMALNKQGKDDEAIAAYQKTLQLSPDMASAHNNLGNIFLEQRKLSEAEASFREAVRIEPGSARLHYNLANALQKDHQYEAAADVFRESLRLEPDYAEAHNNLGTVLKELEELDEAVECYRRALELNPGYAEAMANLGSVLQQNDELEEAIELLRGALKSFPESAGVYCSLGRGLQKQKHLEEAVECYDAALKYDPDYADAHFCKGLFHFIEDRLEEARGCYERGLELDPAYVPAWIGLGRVFHNQGLADRSIDCCARALDLRPDDIQGRYNFANAHLLAGRYAEAKSNYEEVLKQKEEHPGAWSNLGSVYKQLGSYVEACACFERALEINPDFSSALNNLAETYRQEGRLEEASKYYQKSWELSGQERFRIVEATLLPPVYSSKNELIEWRARLFENVDRLVAEECHIDAAKQAGMNLFYVSYQGFNDRELLERIGRCFRSSYVFTPRRREAGEKIRVGFISEHFKSHTIGVFMRGLIGELSRDQFHVTVFSHIEHRDPLGQSIRESCDEYIVLTEQISVALDRLSDQKLDVLFYADIGMDPLTYTLACSRLAPVQCVTWGHPMTTGLKTIDYFLSSELIETPDADDHYTEQLVRLKTLPTYYYRPQTLEGLKTREELGLPVEANLYLCPQSLFKFHPDFDAVLAEILERDPKGQIITIDGLHKLWTETLQKRFEQTVPDHDRIRFLPRLGHDKFLSLVWNSNVMLDPMHFGGGNTSYQALGLGTPIVTLPSSFMRGRVTSGLYERIGVTDCIAANEEEYVALAIRAGTDPEYRKEISERILKANDVLYEDEAVVREIEQFLSRAVEDAYRDGPGTTGSNGVDHE